MMHSYRFPSLLTFLLIAMFSSGTFAKSNPFNNAFLHAGSLRHSTVSSPIAGPLPTGFDPRTNGFMQNRGQVVDTDGKLRSDILFTTGSNGVSLFVGPTQLSYVFLERVQPMPAPDESVSRIEEARPENPASLYRMDMQLLGANPSPRLTMSDPIDGVTHFYLPSSPNGIISVRSYRTLTFENVYHNIDLVYSLTDAGLKYDFVVRPGGRVSDIRFHYNGALNVAVTPAGELHVRNPIGEVYEGTPVTYLGTRGSDAAAPRIRSAYVIEDGIVRFDIGEYDESQSLVIDPTLQWSTYFGGINQDWCTGVSYDATGNVVVSGYTYSPNLPVSTGPFQGTNAGAMDAFIVKFSPLGARLWATYYGGSSNEFANAIATDAGGNVIVAGETMSVNFPVTPGAFQTVNSGIFDGWLAKFNPAGTRLYATYIGGSGDDKAFGIATDGVGNMIVTGHTASANFPITPGAYQVIHAGVFDAFIIKFDPSGAQLWGTFYGGSLGESGESVAVDASGNVLVTGSTLSTNFPVTVGAFQTAKLGGNDGFIVKLDGSGARQWATFVGGGRNDYARGIATDASNNVVITGVTNSTDFPTTVGAFRTFNAGGEEAFVAKFNSSGARQWCTYFGGVLNDGANGVGIDGLGNIAIAGFTFSPNLPISAGSIQSTIGGAQDGFIAKFHSSGSRIWATFFGGNGDDILLATASQFSGNTLVSGFTVSTNYPVTVGAFQTTSNGNIEGTVSKLCDVKPVITMNRSPNLCPGDSVTLNAGPGYATYLWNTGATTQTIKVADSGKYTVTVTDGTGCMGTADTIRVRVAPALTADAGPDKAICLGDGVVIGSPPTGGALPLSYAWTPLAGLNNPSVQQPIASPTTTTKYFLRITDAFGCVNIDSMIVTVNPVPSVNAGPDTLICYGTGVVIGNPATGGTPGYTYSWLPTAGLSSPSVAQPTASPTTSRRYTVTVTDVNGCIAVDSVFIRVDRVVVNPIPRVEICAGDTIQIGAFATGGIGPFTYAWSPSTGLSATNVARPLAYPASTTTYTLTVTDSAGCQNISTVEVAVYNSLTAFAGPDTSVCLGSGVVIGDTAVCGTTPYTYSWSPATGLSSATVLHPIASPGTTTQYILTVTDATLATAMDTVIVTVYSNPLIDAGPDSLICQGASVVIGNLATGGVPPYVYQWTPTTGLSNPSTAQPTASPTVTTKYFVRVTTATGCIATDSILVQVSDLTARAGIDKEVCLNSSVAIGQTAIGGQAAYTYSWSPTTGLSSSTAATPSATPLITTDYIVTVTDARGCIDKDTVRVTVLQRPFVDAGNDTLICRYERAFIGNLATGGNPPYTYAWTPATGLNSTTIAKPTARPLATTKYFVTVTDSKGCTWRDSVRVNIRPFPTARAGNDTTICRGDTARIGLLATGGTPGYIYSWEPRTGLSDTSAARPWANPFFSTTYYLTVTDANGCQAFDTVTVRVDPHPLPTVLTNGPLVFCEGGSVVLSVDPTRMYSGYLWTTGDTSRTITVTQTGFYKAIVNTNGCPGESNTVHVIVVPRPRPRVTVSGPQSFCQGLSITFESDSGAYWKYQWYNGLTPVGTSRKLVVTQSGNYSVTATDTLNGCVGSSPSFPITVFPSPQPVISSSGSTTFCAGDSTILDAGVWTSYLWSNGATTRRITVKQGGTHFVTVRDANGCEGVSSSVTVVVNQNPNPVITANGPLSFCEGSSVTLDAGAGFASYLWSNGATARRITVDMPGTFFVLVTNTAGCSKTSASVTVIVKQRPRPSITALRPTTFCQGDSTILDAGDGYASYLWNNGARTRFITVKTNVTRSVTVTDTAGCSGTALAVQITVNPNPVPTISANGPLTFCPSDSVILDAGAGWISYQWSNGARERTIIVRNSGAFTVTVTNANGCTGTSAAVTTTRANNPTPQITPEGPTTFCQGQSTILDAGAGYASYFWSTGARTRRITVTQSGIYNVRVSDARGCEGESPFITITVNPNPPTPVISEVGNTLVSTTATAYQWSVDGVIIPGAINRIHIPTKSGKYRVTIKNEFGCSSTSAEYSYTMPTGIDAATIPHLSIYPEPTTGLVTVEIELSQAARVTLTITNLLGQQIYQESSEAVEPTFRKAIDLSGHPSGLYILHVSAGYQRTVRKILKQ